MRSAVVVLLAACSANAKPAAKADVAEEPAAAPTHKASATPRGDCIVVGGELEGKPASATGTLLADKGTLALRLDHPRCVVGLPHASVLTEVAVVTNGPDLRPLAGARVKIDGDVLGGTNEFGGPAVVLVAKEITRVE